VSCTASDAAANTDTFNVNVGVDAGSADTLIDEIKALNLSNGVEHSLIGPLKNVTKLLEEAALGMYQHRIPASMRRPDSLQNQAASALPP
jgi:hypothetical protein